MASSSDSDDSNSSDNDSDSVFYDANDSLNNSETTTPRHEYPKWRIPSRSDPIKRPEPLYSISLTESHWNDIERRDKLQRLRTRGDSNTGSKQSNEAISPTSQTPHQKKHSISEENSPNDYHQQRSLASSTLPAKSTRTTDGFYSNRKPFPATSESNIVDLSTIDRITRYGEISPNSEKLDDDEILQQPIVRNLDSGKYIRLSDANPMTQTILERVHRHESVAPSRQTSIFNSSIISKKTSSDINNLSKSEVNLSRQKHQESFSSDSSSTKSSLITTVSASFGTGKLPASSEHTSPSKKKQFSKLVMTHLFRRKKKTKDQHHHHHHGDIDDEDDENERFLINDGSNGDLKYKASRYLKEPAQFDKTQLLQTIVNAHDGPIWCMRFSPDGHLLVTGGQDSTLKVWVFRSAQPHFHDFSHLTSNSQNKILTDRFNQFHQQMQTESITSTMNAKLGLHEHQGPLFASPFCELLGHQAPVLDVAWSKSLFLLSSSMDKTVRLWHLSRLECLCFFRHVDFVSAIAFHPRDDRYFVSASLDGHVRLWNIPDKRVVYWSLIPAQTCSPIPVADTNLITAVNFCDDGRKVTVGTFDGRFLLYTDSLQYDTMMDIGEKDGSRSHRSRKKRRKPYKITGIESMNLNYSKVLITSNDSRIRLYDIRTKEIERKYRGYSNQSSQIRASFSHDDRYIISGSEDSWFYIWRTEPTNTASMTEALTHKQRRHSGRGYERIRVHNTMVTSAIFAPNPVAIMNCFYSSMSSSPSITRLTFPVTSPIVNNRAHLNNPETSASNSNEGSIYVMLTADSKGQLKLLVNRYHRSM